MLGSILLGKNSIDFRYENQLPEIKSSGIIVGIDTGVKSVFTSSDGQISKLTDKHGHSFESILTKLSRKKKESKAFRKTQDQRKNFINWSINQLNLSEINQVNLEHIDNLFYKHNTSRKLKGFTNKLIEDKLKRYLSAATKSSPSITLATSPSSDFLRPSFALILRLAILPTKILSGDRN